VAWVKVTIILELQVGRCDIIQFITAVRVGIEVDVEVSGVGVSVGGEGFVGMVISVGIAAVAGVAVGVKVSGRSVLVGVYVAITRVGDTALPEQATVATNKRTMSVTPATFCMFLQAPFHLLMTSRSTISSAANKKHGLPKLSDIMFLSAPLSNPCTEF
jgi:hypothetical protein